MMPLLSLKKPLLLNWASFPALETMASLQRMNIVGIQNLAHALLWTNFHSSRFFGLRALVSCHTSSVCVEILQGM